jgi:acyl-CoA thioesterase FadM
MRNPTWTGSEIETARSVVYPWLCDSMGHLATQHYMRVFDDATYHLLGRLGYSLHDSAKTRRGWADVSHSIKYRRELLAGDLAYDRLGVPGHFDLLCLIWARIA